MESINRKINSGIATAMNKGIRLLIKKGIDYVITMDQDSQLTENVVNVYRKYLACHKNILALTPQYLTDRSIPKDIKGTVKVKSSLQSGTLFYIRIFDKIGYFDDKKSYLKSMNEGIHDARNNVFGEKRYEFF